MSHRSMWEGCNDAPRISGWARDVIAGRWGMRLLVAGERDGGQEGGFVALSFADKRGIRYICTGYSLDCIRRMKGKRLLLGDEAIALGALHAGLSGVYAYP